MLTSNLKFNSNPEAQLILIGVGPGDPSLLTLAAVEAIKQATVVAFPVPKFGGNSFAADIASPWIEQGKKKIPLIFPMVSELELKKQAWREASEKLAFEVSNGEQVAFLCVGDVSLFATGSYLLLDIKSNYPECPIKIIPGINSFSAAAAAGHCPLGMQQEQLLITPTPEEPETLESLLQEARSLERILVLMKLGKRWSWVRPLLEKMNLLEETLFAKKVGFPDQKIMYSIDVPPGECDYFSLLLVRQNWNKIL